MDRYFCKIVYALPLPKCIILRNIKIRGGSLFSVRGSHYYYYYFCHLSSKDPDGLLLLLLLLLFTFGRYVPEGVLKLR